MSMEIKFLIGFSLKIFLISSFKGTNLRIKNCKILLFKQYRKFKCSALGMHEKEKKKPNATFNGCNSICKTHE